MIPGTNALVNQNGFSTAGVLWNEDVTLVTDSNGGIHCFRQAL